MTFKNLAKKREFFRFLPSLLGGDIGPGFVSMGGTGDLAGDLPRLVQFHNHSILGQLLLNQDNLFLPFCYKIAARIVRTFIQLRIIKYS